MTAPARFMSTTPTSFTARSWRGSAKKGESFLALDGKPYEVDETMCVIADQARVLGLGGVMGGEATGCTEATTNIFIESAYFDPGADRRHRAKDRHQLRTHAIGSSGASIRSPKCWGSTSQRK